jgi:hypothetical protein
MPRWEPGGVFMRGHRGITVALAILLLLNALPFLYLGAYYWMLDARTIAVRFGDDVDIIGAMKPHYRFGGKFSEVFFAPAHAVDKHLHPDEWEKERVEPAQPATSPMNETGGSNTDELGRST